MQDFQLTGFVGYDAQALQKLLTAALNQTPNWRRLDLLAFFQALQQAAATQAFDLQRVQYRPLDNTLWFAPAPLVMNSKRLSPQEFAQQVNPQWHISGSTGSLTANVKNVTEN